MNQTQIRYLLAAGWGVYAGVVAGYFISKKKWEKIANDEIESVKEQYARRQEVVFKQVTTPAETKNPDGPNIVVDAKFTKEYASALLERERVDSRLSRDSILARESIENSANEIADDPTVFDGDDEEEEEEGLNEAFKDDDPVTTRLFQDTDRSSVNTDRPYVISVDEYMDSEPAYDKLTLRYYDEDDILTDENGSVVRSVDKVIGDESITQFGERSGSADIVYVRNERLETDYEVMLESTSFQEAVLRMKQPKIRARKSTEDDDS